MCTNSISGHHLQMAQGVARIDRTTPLSSFRKPKTQRNANPTNTKLVLNPKPYWKMCTNSGRCAQTQFQDKLTGLTRDPWKKHEIFVGHEKGRGRKLKEPIYHLQKAQSVAKN